MRGTLESGALHSQHTQYPIVYIKEEFGIGSILNNDISHFSLVTF